jgi:environmental stress-induced protein Ves
MKIGPQDFRSMPWKNGQGVTHEIAREPALAENFLWRLSLAEVAASGDFSLFPGYDRTIALIAGDGMALDFEEAPAKRLDRPLEPFDFRGEWHCRSRLLSGPCRDLNLMVDRSRAVGMAERLALKTETVRRDIGEGWLLAYCAQGEIEIDGERAAAGEVLKFGAGRHIVAGRGLALAMTVHMLGVA